MSLNIHKQWNNARKVIVQMAVVFCAGISSAEAVDFKGADSSSIPCTGSVIIEKGGVVRCVETGATLLQSCGSDLIFDAQGVVFCPTSAVPPDCTLTASPTSIVKGKSALLTAKCTPTPSSYVWTAYGTPFTRFGTAAGGYVAPTATTEYTVQGINSAGQAGKVARTTVTVTSGTTTTPTPTSVPSCTLSKSNGPYAGSTYLNATCNPAATSYAWSANAIYNNVKCGSTQTCVIGNPTVATDYTMTGSNSAGTGNTASINVAPTVSCSLTADKPSIGLGDSSTLKASCSPASSGYEWSADTKCGTTAAELNTCTVSPTVTTTYTVKGTGTNTSTSPGFQVTVVQPTCTLTRSKASIGLGDSSTLTASCSPAASGYVWSAETGCGTTTADVKTCTVTPQATGTYSYTVTGTGTNIATSSGATVTVVAPYCNLSASPTSVSLGSSSTLTASCSPAASGYVWSDANCGTTTANTCTVTPQATTTYTVTGTTAGATVTNIATSPGATVAISTTPTGCVVSSVTWAAGLAAYPGGTPVQTIHDGEMQAFGMTQSSHVASIARLSYSKCSTDFSISENKCEWGTDDLIAKGCTTSGVDPMLVNQTSDQPPTAGACVLKPNTVYYFNVRPSSTIRSCNYYLSY